MTSSVSCCGGWWTDLNFDKLKAEAAARWFRPNEIYAVLANHERFKVHAQPIDKPVSMCFAPTLNLAIDIHTTVLV